MELFSKPNCPKCIMLMHLLEKKKVSYKYIDVTKDEKSFNELSEKNIMSLPVMRINNELETDYDLLVSMFK